MKVKAKQKINDLDESVIDIVDDDIINIYFKKKLNTVEKKYKYLEIQN